MIITNMQKLQKIFHYIIRTYEPKGLPIHKSIIKYGHLCNSKSSLNWKTSNITHPSSSEHYVLSASLHSSSWSPSYLIRPFQP